MSEAIYIKIEDAEMAIKEAMPDISYRESRIMEATWFKSRKFPLMKLKEVLEILNPRVPTESQIETQRQAIQILKDTIWEMEQ